MFEQENIPVYVTIEKALADDEIKETPLDL